MNFTTLIMLIFTAILAIGLVSKGLSKVANDSVVYPVFVTFW